MGRRRANKPAEKEYMNETSIGIEIEVNRVTPELMGAIDESIWKRADEHCGTELRSIPCLGPSQIRALFKSIGKMGKADTTGRCGFDNAGTHIHIDFIPTPKSDNPRKEEDLKKIDTSKPEVFFCDSCQEQHEEPISNPFQGADHYFTDSSGNNWKSVHAYIKAWRPEKPKAVQVYSAKKKYEPIVESVKRFLILGKRFAHILYGIQTPERRINKYCHTIEFWDEKTLMECDTIKDICESPKLLNNHRRTMINPLAFQKYGTVEVRMIAASLDEKELWAQTVLFCKMARLAKSNQPLPTPSGNIGVDFVNLMNATGVHGKVRTRLAALLTERAKLKPVSRCYVCSQLGSHDQFLDFGLSRPVCRACNKSYMMCDYCGHRHPRDRDHSGHYTELDNKGPNALRYKCQYCADRHGHFRLLEEKHGGIHLIGGYVPNGFDKDGNALKRM